MNGKNRRADRGIEADPYGEAVPTLIKRPLDLLGGRFHFESNNEQLLALVDEAYAGLPSHRLSSKPKNYRIKLMLTPTSRAVTPPALSMLHGVGFLGSATPSSTVAIVSPKERKALVAVARDMLRFPYHLRYEVIEFAVFTLACRSQGLVPLHAACIGLKDRGILLMGASGAGKSTMALQCLTNGFQFLSEDSVFVEPASMRATGVANFLHVTRDTLRWVDQARIRSMIRKSPLIERRSGIEKFEINLRRKPFQTAKKPLEIIGVAFLSSRRAGRGRLIRPLSKAETSARLRREQAYGARLPQWEEFQRKLLRLERLELLRGHHPSAGADALRSLLLSP